MPGSGPQSTDVVSWVAASILGVVFLFVALANPYEIIKRLVLKDPALGGYSCVPFVGGVAGMLAVLVAPIATLRLRAYWCWVPLLLDITISVFLPWLLFLGARQVWRRVKRR